MKFSHSSTVSVRYDFAVIRAGKVVASRRGKNMVVDGGLNSLGTQGIFNRLDTSPGAPFGIAKFGSGTSPIKRGSAGVTFTTTGAGTLTVTASAGFFLAADVGRILKLDTGEEMRVTAYTSGTVVTATTLSGSITQGQQGTIHYVSDSALAATNTDLGNMKMSRGGMGYNSVTCAYSIGYTGTSKAATAAATINEMGWFSGYYDNYSSSAGAMTGRVLLGSPVGIQIGDIVQLSLTVTIVMDQTATVVSAGDFSGTSRFWGDTSGAGASANVFLPTPAFTAYSGTADQSTMHSTAPTCTGSLGNASGTPVTANPAPGVFAITGKFKIGDGNGTIKTLQFAAGWFHVLDTAFVKNSTMTMDVTFTRTFGRTLTN